MIIMYGNENIQSESPSNAAATIAIALFYLQREAQATGLDKLALMIDNAVKEASNCAVGQQA